MVAVFMLLASGRRQIISVRRAGDCTGYLSENGRYQYTGIALTAVTACAFDRRKFDQLVATNPAMGTDLGIGLSSALTQAGHTLVALGQLPSTARVAFLLREMSRWEGNSECALTLRLSRSDIADTLGMNLETVSRRFTDLRNRGIIRLRENDVVEILDWNKLNALAGMP